MSWFDKIPCTFVHVRRKINKVATKKLELCWGGCRSYTAPWRDFQRVALSGALAGRGCVRNMRPILLQTKPDDVENLKWCYGYNMENFSVLHYINQILLLLHSARPPPSALKERTPPPQTAAPHCPTLAEPSPPITHLISEPLRNIAGNISRNIAKGLGRVLGAQNWT